MLSNLKTRKLNAEVEIVEISVSFSSNSNLVDEPEELEKDPL